MRPRLTCCHDVEGILQAEGVRQKNKAKILAQYGQIGISQDMQQCVCLIRYNLGKPEASFCENCAWASPMDSIVRE